MGLTGVCETLVWSLLLATSMPACAGRGESPRIEQLAWLSGCWELTLPERTVEEHWLAPRGQAMIGVSRTVRNGRMTEYETVVLRVQENQFAYEAHPSGQPSAVFVAREATDARVVFENAEHDYPQKVGYERQSTDRLSAWIEGTQSGQVTRVDFPYRRVPCP